MVEDLQPSMEALGVKFHEVYATLSVDKNKDINEVLDGNYEPYQKNVLDVINSKFLTSIKTNRPAVDDSTLTGKIYFAPQAIALGLIDEIGSLDYAISVSSDLSPAPIELSQENETNNQQNMKIKETWKSIQSFFKMDPADLETQELTTERSSSLMTNWEMSLPATRNWKRCFPMSSKVMLLPKRHFWLYSRRMLPPQSLPPKMQIKLKAALMSRFMHMTKSQMNSVRNL